MKEKPINCSGDEVRAILAGALTELRRAIKPTMTPPRVAPLRIEPWIINDEQEEDEHGCPCWAGFHPDYPGEAKWFTCPYGRIGDRLWVRETWAPISLDEERRPISECTIEYRADTGAARPGGWDADPTDPEAARWRPSTCMPRTTCRIMLEITNVDVDTTSIEWVISFRRVQP